MTKILKQLCVFLFLAGTAAAAPQAALFDELDVLYPDTGPKTGVQEYKLDTPRGVPVGIHILIKGLEPDADFSWKLQENGKDVPEAKAFKLIDVPVEQNTGLDSRTEIFKKKKNPYVIRRAPFRLFEALEPVGKKVKARKDGVLALRLEVPVAPDAKPGLNKYSVIQESGSWKKVLAWNVTVHAVTVPPSSSLSQRYTNWFNPYQVARRHDLTIWSGEFWKMLEQYADLMARGRQNTFLYRWSAFAIKKRDGTIELHKERALRYARVFIDRGFTTIEGGHFAGRHEGKWGATRLDLVVTGSDVTSDQGKKEAASFCKQINAILKDLNLGENINYLQHLSDEPNESQVDAYKALAAEVRKNMPGVKIFDANHSRKLSGSIDHWCPQIHDYQNNMEFFEGRKKAGDAVWAYTCLVPGGKWMNRLLDQERTRMVYLHWGVEKYDLAGFLHWGLNHYRCNDPFEQSVVPHGAGPPNYLPAGDSHIVYPGKYGPYSSQRFEAHRMGMEDAELLKILKKKDSKAAAEVIGQVVRSFDDYSAEVSAYRKAKKRLLEALEK